MFLDDHNVFYVSQEAKEMKSNYCCWLSAYYYGDRGVIGAGDPYKGAKDFYFKCSVHNKGQTNLKNIKNYCEGCKDYFIQKVDPPTRIDPSKIREIEVTEKGIKLKEDSNEY